MPRSTSVKVRGQRVGSVLSVHRVGSRDKTQAVRLCGRCLYPLSQITGPHSLFTADFIYSHHVCAHTHGRAYPKACMWRSQDKSVESVPSFHLSGFQESNSNHEARVSGFSNRATADCASVGLRVSASLEKDAGTSQWPPDRRVLVHSGPKLPAILIYYLQVDNYGFQFSHI